MSLANTFEYDKSETPGFCPFGKLNSCTHQREGRKSCNQLKANEAKDRNQNLWVQDIVSYGEGA